MKRGNARSWGLITLVALVIGTVVALDAIRYVSSRREAEAERTAAYILVKEGAATMQWNYQQLPMRECSWCHRTVNLNRHHVIPQAANPALRDVPDNLVVLCRDCHFVLGHRCDWKQYNPDVMYICTHFTNCVRSATTRYAITNRPERAATGRIDTERIMHVTNDVPGNMRSALERILKSEF